jgi:hypothetical protein
MVLRATWTQCIYVEVRLHSWLFQTCCKKPHSSTASNYGASTAEKTFGKWRRTQGDVVVDGEEDAAAGVAVEVGMQDLVAVVGVGEVETASAEECTDKAAVAAVVERGAVLRDMDLAVEVLVWVEGALSHVMECQVVVAGGSGHQMRRFMALDRWINRLNQSYFASKLI